MKNLTEDTLIDNAINWDDAKCWCLLKDKDFLDTLNIVKNKKFNESEQNSLTEGIKEWWKEWSSAVERYNQTSGKYVAGVGGPNSHFQSQAAQQAQADMAKSTADAAADLGIDVKKFVLEFIEHLKIFFKDVFKSIAAQTIAITVVYALYKTHDIWFPKIQLLFRRIMAGQKLAYCEFSTANNNYVLSFDIKKQCWVLDYLGFKSSMLNKSHKPSAEEFTQLLNSETAKIFVKRCTELCEQYLNDKRSLACLTGFAIDKDLPRDTRKLCTEVVKNSKRIIANMKRFKVEY